MTRPETTYELILEPVANEPHARAVLKQALIGWLGEQGVDEFVEGIVEADDAGWDESQDLETAFAASRLSVFKYARDYLEGLARGVEAAFCARVQTRIRDVATSAWLDGWKESFQPFATEKFYVYPPWRKGEIPGDKIPVEIEPGMAFGTGQHATTQLCLKGIEQIWGKSEHDYWLDVGTGTAILSIAAKKLGVQRVIGTDVDADAILAAKGNAERNSVELEILSGSFPEAKLLGGKKAAVLIANILTPILRMLMAEFAQHVRPGGFVILAGLLAEDVKDLTKRAAAVGMQQSQTFELNGWGCLILRKS